MLYSKLGVHSIGRHISGVFGKDKSFPGLEDRNCVCVTFLKMIIAIYLIDTTRRRKDYVGTKKEFQVSMF